MNIALLRSLTNAELVNEVDRLDEFPTIVSAELARRFCDLVNTGVIESDSSGSNNFEADERASEIDELREAIRNALDALSWV